MSIIQTINPEYNFWEIYPELKGLEEFKELQKEYKSKASDVMWFIVLCFDIDSKFINIPLDERAELLGKDYLKNKNFYRENSKIIESSVLMYEKIIDTPAKRHLRQWLETLEKRTKFLKDTEYDLDNYDKLDKMAVGTAKIFDTFKVIQEQMSKEKGIGSTKGGHELSLADSDEI